MNDNFYSSIVLIFIGITILLVRERSITYFYSRKNGFLGFLASHASPGSKRFHNISFRIIGWLGIIVGLLNISIIMIR